jgi:hypothetical protein
VKYSTIRTRVFDQLARIFIYLFMCIDPAPLTSVYSRNSKDDEESDAQEHIARTENNGTTENCCRYRTGILSRYTPCLRSDRLFTATTPLDQTTCVYRSTYEASLTTPSLKPHTFQQRNAASSARLTDSRFSLTPSKIPLGRSTYARSFSFS